MKIGEFILNRSELSREEFPFAGDNYFLQWRTLVGNGNREENTFKLVTNRKKGYK